MKSNENQNFLNVLPKDTRKMLLFPWKSNSFKITTNFNNDYSVKISSCVIFMIKHNLIAIGKLFLSSHLINIKQSVNENLKPYYMTKYKSLKLHIMNNLQIIFSKSNKLIVIFDTIISLQQRRLLNFRWEEIYRKYHFFK